MTKGDSSDFFAVVSIVRNGFCYNVHRTCHCILGGEDFFFFIYVFCSKVVGVAAFFCLQIYEIGKRFQPLFFGNGGSCASFGAERTINVFKLLKHCCSFNFFPKFVGQIALFIYETQNLLSSFVERTKIVKAIKKTS